GRGREREDGDLLVEGLYDRHAEAFVLAGAEEEIRDLVKGHELLVGDMPDEMYVRRVERRREMIQRGEVALASAVGADDDEAGGGIEDGVICMEEADEILNLLVRDHPADEHDVRPVIVEVLRQDPLRLAVEV